MKTRQLTLDALLAAMCTVLGYFHLDFQVIEVGLESLPVILGAALFGPIDGMCIGFIGTLLSQLLRYGISVTTALWILPYVVCGLVVGLWARWNGFDLSKPRAIGGAVVGELSITLLNTLALWVDSTIFGYNAALWVMIIPRLAVSVLKAVLIGMLLPELLFKLRKYAGVPATIEDSPRHRWLVRRLEKGGAQA